MVDYAQSTVKSQVKAKSKASSISLEVAVPQLGFALIIAVFIYVLGYQNSTISQVQHGINIKKARLMELEMQMASLQAKKAHILSSGSIVAESVSKDMKLAKNIQIVY